MGLDDIEALERYRVRLSTEWPGIDETLSWGSSDVTVAHIDTTVDAYLLAFALRPVY
jgi:hypothetical protein